MSLNAKNYIEIIIVSMIVCVLKFYIDYSYDDIGGWLNDGIFPRNRPF